MATYAELTGAGATTRDAAELRGLTRSTATRRRPEPPVRPGTAAAASEPAVRGRAMGDLDGVGPGPVRGPAPIQIYATLLDEGTYLCSISTMYRILADHAQLVEPRRIAPPPFPHGDHRMVQR